MVMTAATLERRLAVLLAFFLGTCHAFQSPLAVAYPQARRTLQRQATSADAAIFENDECFITPDGFGFSTPASRILSTAQCKPGYTKVSSSDRVVDVMDQITTSDEGDVALVYDDDATLVGLFTESDYIRFSTERARAASSEEESVEFLLTAPVRSYLSSTLLGITPSTTANVAIATMQRANVRHVVVAEPLSPQGELIPGESVVTGVVSMQDVMALVQRDERLSLTSLQRKYPNIPDPSEQMKEELQSIANELSNNPETAKDDVIRVGTALLAALAVAGFFSQSIWLHDHADLVMIAIFVLGYMGIIFEEVFEFNKAGVALLMSTGLWVTYADYFDSAGQASGAVLSQLSEQLAEVSDICFFLLAASTIVEVVDSHQGFKVVTNRIQTTSKKELFWTIGFLTFFLSAILNNLTVTIVMVSLLRKLIPNEADRKRFGAMVVVAANAGGVWTPIGDV